jgi:2-isopropylmalate synthase
MRHIQLYDATLRDGMGGGGMTLTAAEKVRVVRALDALGVHMIEAGFPASNPKEQELFQLLASESLQSAEIAAFGMTRRRGVQAAEDEGLRVLAESFVGVCTLVGKSSSAQAETVLKVTRAENLSMIGESIALLVAHGKRVLFDAEHFFDGIGEDVGYALECVRVAADAGAERVVLCDTNGGSLPLDVREAVVAVREQMPDIALGVHTHDDTGCAVANTLVAVEAGATQVQGTINGIGERTGNANLVTIIADLQLKLGYEVLPAERLARLTETAHFVDELLNRTPDPAQPYVGKHAFAHKAGLHAAGVRESSVAFEHVDPALVGNSRDVLVSELAGGVSIIEKAAAMGMDVEEETARRLAARIKELEHKGFQFETADGSVELLIRKETGEYEPLFRLGSWRVIVEQDAQGHTDTEATITLWDGEERHRRTAHGNGPVHALDQALRDAIVEFHPHLQDVELVDYKVRLLETSHGTGATTRVHIESSDGHRTWGTVGVGENVIAASWQALVDALEYAEQRAPVRR